SGEGATRAFEVEITTNRVDAMNHYGVARECAAIYNTELKPLAAKLPAAKGKPEFAIEIKDPDLCARFSARIVRGVTIKASPKAVVERLELLESRPINNVADATNYNLLEMGHPTHAYDLDLLEGHKHIVRRARPGETLKTLDGVERKLSKDDLVIADAHRPVGLAGVMGGFDTMITERTRNVLIEAAWFDPVSVRKTARRHGMHTDASHRFERGADVGATALACARVAQRILENAGGELEGGEIDVLARKLAPRRVRLRHSEVRRILGQDIPGDEIERILEHLGFTVAAAKPAKAGKGARTPAILAEPAELTAEIPSWRLDVEREIDLIEEVARLYGYDRFPNTLPAFSGSVVEAPHAAQEARLRSDLLALGYHEAISLTFISRQDAARFASASPAEIANPISEEATCIRTSLLPGMLDMLAWNLNRGNPQVRLFESGNVFALEGAAAREERMVCLGATGAAEPACLHRPARAYSFFDLKGDVETLLSAFQHTALYFDGSSADYYHPGRSARAVMDGATVARFGQIHPEVAAGRKLRQEVYIAEILLERLFAHGLRQPHYRPVPRFPAVERDFSFLFDNTVSFEQIRGAVEALGLGEMRSFQPVEIFRGGGVPEGRYSVLLRASFQSAERTLRDDEVQGWSQQIVKALQGLGGTLRA
ncbi:MAG TPA: phenylalanine--tRNA ligase subunit beta, partial [Terriglobales bacterium]|nr:phenylalanine--tRNA ligase subunit beta [Terriglobales bacterium]